MRLAINKIKENPENPRYIRDEQFNKLVKSIKEFPEMLSVRKLVVNKDYVVLGGNMRLKALKEAGIKEVDVEVVEWTKEKEREFIVKDNLAYGSWDWETLANEWEVEDLHDWGLDVPHLETPDIESIFGAEREETSLSLTKITLSYEAEECAEVKEALRKHGKTPEEAVKRLLGL